MIYSMQILMIILLVLGLTTCATLVAWLAVRDEPEEIPEEELLHLSYFETEESGNERRGEFEYHHLPRYGQYR